MTGLFTSFKNKGKSTSSYDITNYLNTQHHWQVSVDGVLSEQKGINDPSLVALPVAVPTPEPEPEPAGHQEISLFGVSSLFNSIENQYNQYFSQRGTTSISGVGDDTIYYRLYNNTGLGTYQGDLYYSLNIDNGWTKFGTVQDAIDSACNGDCYAGNFCSIDGAVRSSSTVSSTDCAYPIDPVGYINNTAKETGIEIVKIYLTVGDYTKAVKVINVFQTAFLLDGFIDGLGDYDNDRDKILYTLEFALRNYALLGGLIAEGAIVNAGQKYGSHLEQLAKFSGTVEWFYVQLEKDGWLYDPEIKDASISLHQITYYDMSESRYKSSRSNTIYEHNSWSWGYGYSFLNIQSGLYLAEINWKDKTYFKPVFVERGLQDSISMLLNN